MTYERLKAGEGEALGSASTEEVGIGGFTFFARVNDQTDYTTDSPTSVVEDGSYIGDHLINAPIRLTISGDVADIFLPPTTTTSRSASRLPTVGKTTSFEPLRTASQLQWVRKIIDTAADRRRSIDELMTGGARVKQLTGNASGSKSYREQFIDFIESIHYGKQLVEISMPFRKHDNMAINSVSVTRDNQRNALTFSLTAQKFRIAKTLFVNASQFYRKPAPAVKSQTAGTSDKGVQSPESGNKKQKSVLTAILGR
jgi:hypothetical protein